MVSATITNRTTQAIDVSDIDAVGTLSSAAQAHRTFTHYPVLHVTFDSCMFGLAVAGIFCLVCYALKTSSSSAVGNALH